MNNYPDIIFDCNYVNQYNKQGTLTYAQIDTAYVITGIDVSVPSLVQSKAYNYLQTLIPVGTPHPNNSICLARNYQIKPMNATDTVEGIVSFVFNEIPISATQWVVESTNFPEMEDTDREFISTSGAFNVANLQPIIISNYEKLWQKFTDLDPGNPNEPPVRGTINVLRPRKQWNYSRTIYSATDAKTLDDAGGTYICTVNSVPFISYTGASYAAGTVLCTNVAVTYQPYQAQNMCTLQFLYHPEGWQPWSRYTNTAFPVPNVWRSGTTGGHAGGAYASNGYYQANGYLATNLNTLVTLIG